MDRNELRERVALALFHASGFREPLNWQIVDRTTYYADADALLPLFAEVATEAWDEGKKAERDFQNRPYGTWYFQRNPYLVESMSTHDAKEAT